jgi:hypothetical protein
MVIKIVLIFNSRSKLKPECMEFLLEKCSKCLDLAAHMVIRALKTTAKAMDVDANDNWAIIVANIGSENPIWANLVHILGDLQASSVEPLLLILIDQWISKAKNDSLPSLKLDVSCNILHLCRGKKISKIDAKICDLICAQSHHCNGKDEKFLPALTSLMATLCSSATSEAVACIETFIGHPDLSSQQKVTILLPVTEQHLFESFYLPRIVTCLIKHTDQVYYNHRCAHALIRSRPHTLTPSCAHAFNRSRLCH